MTFVFKASPPNVFIGGPGPEPPGFPLKACGNDGLRKGNSFFAASCGESTHRDGKLRRDLPPVPIDIAQ